MEQDVREPGASLGPRQAYYALFVLWLANLLANIDRYSVTLIFQQVKIDLQLTDTQLGLTAGAAFVVSYTLFGIPIARWLDRGIRSHILAWSVGVWSMMAIAFGSAVSFAQVALARAGLGAGEAASLPGSVSLIGDYFGRDKRTQAVGVLHSALAGSSIVGGPLVGILTDRYGWRTAVIALGAAGLALALLMRWTLREPPRLAARAAPDAAGRDTFAHALRAMFSNRAFVYLLVGHAIYGIGIYAWVSWYPVTLVRAYGLSYTKIGVFLGIWTGIAMMIASLFSGWLCPAVVRRTGDDRWMARLPALFSLLAIPGIVVTCLEVSEAAAMLAGGAVLFMTIARTPPMLSLALDLVPASMHSLATLVIIIVTNNIGAALGPVLVGMISDALLADLGQSLALRQGLLWIAPLFGLVGALLAFLPARFMARQTPLPPLP